MMKKLLYTLMLSMVGVSQMNAAHTDTDVSGIDNVVYIAPAKGVVGKEATLSVQLKNVAPNTVIGYQFELNLPEGITALSATPTTDREASGHTHSMETSFEDGGNMVLCYSFKNYTYTGTSGEVATIKVNVAESVQTGSYPIILHGEAISLDGSTPTFDYDIVSTITVSTYGNYGAHIINEVEGTGFNPEPGIYSSLKYIRNFKKTGWQALYVPFEMSYEDWNAAGLEVAYIEGFLSYDYDGNGTIDETRWSGVMLTSGTLLPNTPYLIRAKSTGVKTLNLNDVMIYDKVINSIDCSSTTIKYEFIGKYNDEDYGEDETAWPYYINNGVIRPTAGVIPFRWIMQMSGRGYVLYNKPKEMHGRVRTDDGLTFLEYVESNKSEFVGCQIYTLDGRMIDNTNQTLAPGLYINNGKKILIK